MRKKILAIALCVLLVAAAFTACSNGSGSSTPDNSSTPSTSGGGTSSDTTSTDPLHFAHIIPLTGDKAQYGAVQQNAMNMKTDEVNAEGGINGRKIVVDFYDDKNDPKETLTLANKIIEDDTILAVFGPFSTTCGMSITATMEKAKIPLISPTPSASDYATQGEYIFTGATVQSVICAENAKFAYNELGVRKAAILYGSDDAGVDINKSFSESFTALGGEIVGSETYVKGTTKDFSPLLTKFKQAGADFIYCGGQYDETALAVQQARSLDMKIPMMGMAATARQELIDICGEDLEVENGGYYAMTNYAPDYPDEDFQAFKTKYEETYGIALENHAVATYDLMTVVCDAIAANGEGKSALELREVIREALTGHTYQGVMVEFEMLEDGNCNKELIPLYVVDGEFVTYDYEV